MKSTIQFWIPPWLWKPPHLRFPPAGRCWRAPTRHVQSAAPLLFRTEHMWVMGFEHEKWGWTIKPRGLTIKIGVQESKWCQPWIVETKFAGGCRRNSTRQKRYPPCSETRDPRLHVSWGSYCRSWTCCFRTSWGTEIGKCAWHIYRPSHVGMECLKDNECTQQRSIQMSPEYDHCV